jgi:hypothetical protein
MALTPKHKHLAYLLGDITDKRTNQAKAEEVGLTGGRVSQLLRVPEFQAEVRAVTDSQLAPIARPKAFRVLYESDEVAGATAVLKATNDIGSGVNVQTNVVQTNEKDYTQTLERWESLRAKKAGNGASSGNGRIRRKVSG